MANNYDFQIQKKGKQKGGKDLFLPRVRKGKEKSEKYFFVRGFSPFSTRSFFRFLVRIIAFVVVVLPDL